MVLSDDHLGTVFSCYTGPQRETESESAEIFIFLGGYKFTVMAGGVICFQMTSTRTHMVKNYGTSFDIVAHKSTLDLCGLAF